MKFTTIILLSVLLVSCGKKGGSGSNSGEVVDPITGLPMLTVEENKLLKRMLEVGNFEQNDLLLELASTQGLTERSLSKIDKHVSVLCLPGLRICSITKKD